MSIKLTCITSTAPSTLTKKYFLTDKGLEKVVSAHMSEGRADVIDLESPAQFADVLTSLQHNQALCYGVPLVPNIRVLSKSQYEKQGSPTDATPRSKEAFNWPNAGGVLMLDYDPQEGRKALNKTELLGAIETVLPEITQCAYVWWASSSSLIFNSDTHEQLTPIKGQRIYLFVKDASDIERAGSVLFQRLWLKGFGFYAISRAGSLLERSIIDASVWQTNRLDFAAGAHCMAPLEQRRGKPKISEGALLDTRTALPNLTPEQQADYKAKLQQAKADAEPERAEVRQIYIQETADKLLASTGKELTEQNLEAAIKTISRAVHSHILTGDFVITLANREEVTIGEVLDNPSKYHGETTLDPLEPEYGNYRVTGKLYLIGGRANLYSQAHGGQNFKLIRQPRKIEHNEGNTADTTHRTLEFLRQMPDVFDHGKELVLVRNGRLEALNRDSLGFYLGSVAQFFCWKKATANSGLDFIEVNLDPTERLLRQTLAAGTARNLKPLLAVISAPIIDLDGRIIERAGYDEKSQLYLDMLGEPLPIPAHPTPQDVERALKILLEPFSDFRTATELDNSVLLAAILTAIVRPILPLSPIIGLDAPVQGTGKTYLAQCLGLLAAGEIPAILPHTAGRDDEETRKRIYSVLLAGEHVLLWDNVLGFFDSAAMASLATAETYTDRKLGASEISEIPNRLLVFLTGNNLTLAGDMPSRVLKIRLDTKLENPTTRQFKGDPLQYIKDHRQELVQAGLTVIKAYLESDTFREGAIPRGARFKEWDLLARQPVAWISKTFSSLNYCDPAKALEEAANNDPEKETLLQALTLIHRAMGATWWTTNELMQRIRGSGYQVTNNELEEVLQDLAGNTKPLTSRGLGRVLSYRVDRLAGGMTLKKRSSSTVVSFKVEMAEK